MPILIEPILAEPAPIAKRVLWLGRLLSGFVLVVMLFDKLVPWPVVTETIDRLGYGSSEALARSLGVVSLVCTVLYAVPPTSILGAILFAIYLGGALASHVQIGGPLFSQLLFGCYLGWLAWAGPWMRDRSLRRRIVSSS